MTNIYILVAAFAAISAALVGIGHKHIAALSGAIIIILAGAGLVFSYAEQIGFFAIHAEGDPKETVTVFLDAMKAENFDLAASCLDYCVDLGLDCQSEDENVQKIAEAMWQNFDYSIPAQAEIDELTAIQTVNITFLDVNCLLDQVHNTTQAELEKIVMERKRSDVYDEDRQLLPEIMDEAYSNALSAALGSSASYMKTESVSLTLNYLEGEWRIFADERMLNLLIGGIKV